MIVALSIVVLWAVLGAGLTGIFEMLDQKRSYPSLHALLIGMIFGPLALLFWVTILSDKLNVKSVR